MLTVVTEKVEIEYGGKTKSLAQFENPDYQNSET